MTWIDSFERCTFWRRDRSHAHTGPQLLGFAPLMVPVSRLVYQLYTLYSPGSMGGSPEKEREIERNTYSGGGRGNGRKEKRKKNQKTNVGGKSQPQRGRDAEKGAKTSVCLAELLAFLAPNPSQR